MSEKYAIEVKGLSKSFRLPLERSSGLKQTVVNWLKGKKGYREQRVLRDVSFNVKKGDFFGIVGRNGSGKSTLLKLVSGIYQPGRGVVKINGSLVSFIELGVGFNKELTGRENVYLNGALMGFSKREVDAIYDEVVDFAELREFMGQKLKNYSSGMQVRLAFACAIQAKSDILILDEVLAVGDGSFQRKCTDYFEKIREDGDRTVVLVTHNMDNVRRYCNRAILLDEGKIEMDSADVDRVADGYGKLFLKTTGTPSNAGGRFGTGELVLDNITHELTNKKILIDFDIINKTQNQYTGVFIGVDFNSDGRLIAGNHLKYVGGYKEGLSFSPKQKKHIRLSFDNLLSKHDYIVCLNIRGDNGAHNFDTIKNAISIRTARASGSPFYYLQLPLRVEEKNYER